VVIVHKQGLSGFSDSPPPAMRVAGSGGLPPASA
jgi:hypothetical protein